MPADKKTDRTNPPRPDNSEKRQLSDEQKPKNEREKAKQKRVNYVIKDLPIY